MPRWRELALIKLAQRDAAIPPEWMPTSTQVPSELLNVIDIPRTCGILDARELEITELDAESLIPKLLSKEYSSAEASFGGTSSVRAPLIGSLTPQVTLAFCKRAAIAQATVSHASS